MKGNLYMSLLVIYSYMVAASCMSLPSFHMSCPVHPTPQEVSSNSWRQNFENNNADNFVTIRVFQCANATAHVCNETATQVVELKQGVETEVNFTTGEIYWLNTKYMGGSKTCFSWRSCVAKDTIIPPELKQRCDCISGCQDTFTTSYINYDWFTQCDAEQKCKTTVSGVKVEVIPPAVSSRGTVESLGFITDDGGIVYNNFEENDGAVEDANPLFHLLEYVIATFKRD